MAAIFSEDVVVRVILFESSSIRESARIPSQYSTKSPISLVGVELKSPKSNRRNRRRKGKKRGVHIRQPLGRRSGNGGGLARNVNRLRVRTEVCGSSWHFSEQTEDAEGVPCRFIHRGRISGAGNLAPAYGFFCSGKRGRDTFLHMQRCADWCGG